MRRLSTRLKRMSSSTTSPTTLLRRSAAGLRTPGRGRLFAVAFSVVTNSYLGAARVSRRIIEDPHAVMLVRRNDVDGIHGDAPAWTKRNPVQSGGDFLGAFSSL